MNKQQLTVSFEGDELAAVMLLILHRMDELRAEIPLQEAEVAELEHLSTFVEKVYDCTLSAILQKALGHSSKDELN